jgi:hypothetical protein
MMVPASVRAHIVGKGGATLKAIIASTGTTIQVGKYEGEAEEDDDIIVTITGSLGAIQDAKREIDAIVGERVFFVHVE